MVVMACYVAAAISLDLFVVHRLTTQSDTRLSQRLPEAARQAPGTSPSTGVTDQDHDVDDAPVFVWSVDRLGAPTSLSTGAPALPTRTWEGAASTVDLGGKQFRVLAQQTSDGWLVAGESLGQLERVRSALLGPELAFGLALMVVVYGGSLLIGLRASAPLELVRRRQAEFTADASHELRTPLSVIEAEVALALSRPRSPAGYEEAIARIGTEGQRLRHIVDDLLWLARAEDDGRTVDGGGADVVAIAKGCVDRFQPVAMERNVTLYADIDEGDPAIIDADPGWIERLVGVLVDNACKHGGKGGTVTAQVVTSGHRILLRVDDSGPGIPPDQRALVFDRFHRGSDEVEGTGLGLAIADSVVRASHGTWAVGRSPLGGARMEVSWRRAHPHPRNGHERPTEEPGRRD